MAHTITQTTLDHFFQKQNWKVEKLGDELIYRLTIPAGVEQFVAYALVEGSHFIFYPMGPYTIPTKFLPEVAEYITRVNNHLWSCSFELDYTTAQIRCKAGYNFKDLELDPQIIENCIYITIETMSTYWPGILAIIAQQKTPAQAYSEFAIPSDNSVENHHTKQLQEAFIQFFEQDKRHFQADSSTLIRVTYGGHNKKSYFCYANLLPKSNSAFFMVGVRGITDENKIPQLIKWITEINYNLRLGYFNYDFSQNHLSFIVGVNFYEVTPHPILIRNMVYPAVTTADKYLPAIQQVLESPTIT